MGPRKTRLRVAVQRANNELRQETPEERFASSVGMFCMMITVQSVGLQWRWDSILLALCAGIAAQLVGQWAASRAAPPVRNLVASLAVRRLFLRRDEDDTPARDAKPQWPSPVGSLASRLKLARREKASSQASKAAHGRYVLVSSAAACRRSGGRYMQRAVNATVRAIEPMSHS